MVHERGAGTARASGRPGTRERTVQLDNRGEAMRRVQYDDWLDEAKRLPVGAVTRVQHKRDGSRRPNLVIGHEPDKYWAYCHACKEGGVHTKEHVRWGERAPAESRRRDIPDD